MMRKSGNPVLPIALSCLTLVWACSGNSADPTDKDVPAPTDTVETMAADAPASSCPGALPLRCGDRLDHDTTVQGRPDDWRGYACSARLESGRETVYDFRPDGACQVSVRLTHLTTDIDLFLLDACDPFASLACSSTPLDIQTLETVAFPALAARDYVLAVDGYAGAEGPYTIEADCLCKGNISGTFRDGDWILAVDREWKGAPGSVSLPSDPLDEAEYEPVAGNVTYPVLVSGGWKQASVGAPQMIGQTAAGQPDRLWYDLSTGTFAGGRFVVWAAASTLQAELTIYGSGVPIVSSVRGTLLPATISP